MIQGARVPPVAFEVHASIISDLHLIHGQQGVGFAQALG
jgi:hypothetical protein